MKRSIIFETLSAPIRIAIGIPQTLKIVTEPSYFPEEGRKNRFVRTLDNLDWLFKYREANRFYNLYGFDLDRNRGIEKTYNDYLSFAHKRDEYNLIKEVNSQVILLRDKYLFYKFMKSNNMPVPDVFAVLRNGKLYDSNMKSTLEDVLLDETDYFVKEIDGECASYVRHIRDYKDYKAIKKEIFGHNCLFQRTVHQCEQMNRLNQNAINTLRIITVYNHGIPYVFSAVLRMGTNRTGSVDNWAKGGLVVGIQKNGYLKKYGFYKPHYGGKTDRHPDTKIVFSDFCVPRFEEACSLACKAHGLFYNVQTIGWDIAITDNGLSFIEGNDNWEISLQQSVDGGLKKEWNEVIRQCQKL